MLVLFCSEFDCFVIVIAAIFAVVIILVLGASTQIIPHICIRLQVKRYRTPSDIRRDGKCCEIYERPRVASSSFGSQQKEQ